MSETAEMLRSIADNLDVVGKIAVAKVIRRAASENDSLRDALSELADLMDDVVEGTYKPDSFTTQPARITLGESDLDQERDASAGLTCE